MNWPKAKTILIIIFTLINIILYNVNIRSAEPKSIGLADGETNEILRILKNNNIIVDAPLPNKYKQMAMLKVKVSHYNKNFIISNFLKNKQYIECNNGTSYKAQDITINVKDGYLYYVEKNDKFKDMDEDTAFSYIKNFINNKNMAEKYSVSNETYSGTKYIVKYSEIYNGIDVDISYMEGVISNGVFLFKRIWLKPIYTENAPKNIITPIEALAKLLEINNSSNKIIVKQVKPVYFFSWKNADIGEAIPAWRITTDNNVYYVNAYTGNIEKW